MFTILNLKFRRGESRGRCARSEKVHSYLIKSIFRSFKSSQELICHALLEGWVGRDCMAVLNTSPSTSRALSSDEPFCIPPKVNLKTKVQKMEHEILLAEAPGCQKRKHEKTSTKESSYSAAKECLKYIPSSAHCVPLNSFAKLKSAAVSACPTPVKVWTFPSFSKYTPSRELTY